MRQNDPSRLSDALMKFALHIIKFPSWYDVLDCSELFSRKTLCKVENEFVSNGKEDVICGFEGNSIIVLMNDLFNYYDLGELWYIRMFHQIILLFLLVKHLYLNTWLKDLNQIINP